MGMVVAFLGDQYHVYTSTTQYMSSGGFQIGIIPYWVYLLFGSASVGFSLLYMLFFYKECNNNFSIRSVVATFILFLGSYLFSGYFSFLSHFDLILLIVLPTLVEFIINRYTFLDFVYIVLVAIIGCGFEITLTKFAIFQYNPPHHHLWGVPFWLFLIYMNLGLCMQQLSKYLLQEKNT